jgi:hypothetical protein
MGITETVRVLGQLGVVMEMVAELEMGPGLGAPEEVAATGVPGEIHG